MGVVCDKCQACIEKTTATRKSNTKSNHNANSSTAYHSNTGGGSSCYSCSARINQRPETGRDDFRIQINAQHHGDHSCDQQTLTVVFNYPVNFIGCSNGSLSSSNNSTKIQVKLRYHNNPNDNIGMGDFIVKSAHHDLQIVSCYINDGH